MNAPVAWSYSSLTKFETCPRQYYLVRVAKKCIDKQTEATMWGNEVHKALELRVKDKTPLPETMQRWEPLAAKFDGRGKVFTETKFTLNRSMQPTTWFGKDAWCRSIIDLGIEKGPRAALFDWKTGKIKHDIDQLKLFSGVYMKVKPYIEVVDTGFIWLNDGKMTKEQFTRGQLPEIWEEFISRTVRLEEAMKHDKWPPRPSGLCNGWCPAGKEHCEFWAPKRS